MENPKAGAGRRWAEWCIGGSIALLSWFPFAWHFMGDTARAVIFELRGAALAPAQQPCISDQCDFMSFWSAGRLSLTDNFATLYDPSAFAAWQTTHLAPNNLYLPFIYPPTVLLPFAVIAYLPFQSAFLVWTCGIVGLSVLLLRYASLSWRAIAAAVLAPASLYTLRLGNFELFTGAVLLAGLMRFEARRVAGGSLLGLTMFKPQAGLLLPVVFMARPNLRSFAAIGAAAALLCVASAVAFGLVTWRYFFQFGAPLASALLNAPFPTNYELSGVSVFWMLRSFGCSIAVSDAAHIAVAACAVLVCWHAWRLPNTVPTARVALTIFLSLLISPYAYVSDMCGYSAAVAMLAAAAGRLAVADVMLWLAPGICLMLGIALHVVLAPVVIVLAAWRAALQLRDKQPAT